jgi:hypothetical protein
VGPAYSEPQEGFSLDEDRDEVPNPSVGELAPQTVDDAVHCAATLLGNALAHAGRHFRDDNLFRLRFHPSMPTTGRDDDKGSGPVFT